MGRDYAVCPHCQDLLPEWMDGTWTCDCGETTIEVDLRADCCICGRSVKEYDIRSVSYDCRHPSGGGMRTNLDFCGTCFPELYQVLVIERPGAFLPHPGETEDGYVASEDVVAGWLSALPHVPLRCGCGEEEWVGGILLPAAEAAEGDIPLADGTWVLRPACIRCVQEFKKSNGLSSY